MSGLKSFLTVAAALSLSHTTICAPTWSNITFNVKANDPQASEWEQQTCQAPGVIDHTMSPIDRWNLVDAPGAWDAVLDGWKQNLTTGGVADKGFSNNVSNYFHGPEKFHCEHFVKFGSGCSGDYLQCPATTHPAGYFILNSFKSLFAVHQNMYSAIEEAHNFEEVGAIADTFAKVKEKDKGLDLAIILDIALLGWGLTMGPFWNKVFTSGLQGAAKDNAGTVKDVVNDMFKGSVGLVKDVTKKKAADAGAARAGLESQMKIMTESWKESVQNSHVWLFQGSEEALGVLDNIIRAGAVYADDESYSNQFDYAKDMMKIITANLIPRAWALAPEGVVPWIAQTDLGCDEGPGWIADGSFTEQARYYVTDGALKDGRVCIDGKSYWLLMGRDPDKQCNNKQENADCEGFDLLPGMDALKNGEHYDITAETVVRGSLNTYHHNGFTNGNPINIEDQDSGLITDILEQGIEMPGVFNLPICSMEEALENYYSKYGHDEVDMSSFPCNKGVPLDILKPLVPFPIFGPQITRRTAESNRFF